MEALVGTSWHLLHIVYFTVQMMSKLRNSNAKDANANDVAIAALALVGGSTAQFRRGQRLRSGRQDTGYAAPPPADDYAQPAYGDDQDVYQVDERG